MIQKVKNEDEPVAVMAAELEQSKGTISHFRKLEVDIAGVYSDGAKQIRVNQGNVQGAMTINLNRTIRVPDNNDTNMLPPSMGQFPMFKVQDYATRMPEDMAKKGGLFIPMYQREAMWMGFQAKVPFALKIYVGGVNAVSGLPIQENEKTMQKRAEMLKEGKQIQDYMVLPDQPWLDGIVSEDGKLRQFVAKPKGSGFSVEVQVTGEEKVGGIQIEIIPTKRVLPEEFDVRFENKKHQVILRTIKLGSKNLTAESTWGDLEKTLGEEFDIPPNKLQVNSTGIIRADSSRDEKLGDMHFLPGFKICLNHQDPPREGGYLRNRKIMEDGLYGAASAAMPPPPGAPMVAPMVAPMALSQSFAEPYAESARSGKKSKARGSGAEKSKVKEMGIAAGGLISQTINPDRQPADIWDLEASIMLNIQILDSEAFSEVTGLPPPDTPVNAKTYADQGWPFFEIWNEEKTGVKGNFDEVKSIAQIEAERARERGEDVVAEESVPQRIITLGIRTFKPTFKPVEVLRKELEALTLK